MLSFITGRFGDTSDGRTFLAGDFGRTMGEIRRTGRTTTCGWCDGGVDATAGAGTDTAAGAGAGASVVAVTVVDTSDLVVRFGKGPTALACISAAGAPGRLGNGERYMLIKRARRSLVGLISETKNKSKNEEFYSIYRKISL